MAFGYTVVEDSKATLGNCNTRVYKLTDIQAAGSSVVIDGAKRILYASANNQTDTDEVMYCSWSTTNTITVMCGTNDDDGYMFVIYK